MNKTVLPVLAVVVAALAGMLVVSIATPSVSVEPEVVAVQSRPVKAGYAPTIKATNVVETSVKISNDNVKTSVKIAD